MKLLKLFWGRLIVIQVILLGIMGVWAIYGHDTEIYQSNDPNAIKNITLPAGTYRSYITYISDCEDSAATYISESDNQLFLADTLQMYPWESVDYIQLWALEDISDVSFVYKRSEGILNISHVSIAATTEWKRILWTFMLFGMMIFDAACLWYRKVKEIYGDNIKEKIFSCCRLVVLICIGIISCKALYINRFIQGHDLVFHLSRIEGLKESILAGQLPVRMQHTWFEGAGYAVSIMYGDILLYVPAILRIMGYTLQTSYKMYIVFISSGTIAITYYALNHVSLSEKQMNKWVAVVATGIYTLSMYRLGDVHLRAALGEYTAIMFFPLVFCGFYRVFHQSNEEKKNIWLMPTIGMTGILTSHIISAVMVTVILAIWCILECTKVIRKKCFFNLCRTVVTTVLLSLAFLVPFLDYTLIGNMKISDNLTDTIKYIQREGTAAEAFWNFTSWGRECRVYGLACTIIGVVLIAIYFLHWNKKSTEYRLILGKILGLFVLTSLLSTNFFPWDALSRACPLVSVLAGTIQFPFRFAGIAMMMLTLAFALILNEESEKKIFVGICCVLSLCISIAAGLCYQTNIRNDNEIYKIYDAAGLGLHVATNKYSTFLAGKGEYIPLNVLDIKEYRFKQPKVDENVLWQNMERDGASLRIIAANQGKEEARLAVPILYYKGYQAKDTQSGEKMEVYSGHNGMATIILPVGYEGQVTVKFISPWYWRISEFITLLIGIYILILMISPMKAEYQDIKIR